MRLSGSLKSGKLPTNVGGGTSGSRRAVTMPPLLFGRSASQNPAAEDRVRASGTVPDGVEVEPSTFAPERAREPVFARLEMGA